MKVIKLAETPNKDVMEQKFTPSTLHRELFQLSAKDTPSAMERKRTVISISFKAEDFNPGAARGLMIILQGILKDQLEYGKKAETIAGSLLGKH